MFILHFVKKKIHPFTSHIIKHFDAFIDILKTEKNIQNFDYY